MKHPKPRCPICHTTIELAAIVEDEALRELMGLLKDLPSDTSRPLVLYLQLFSGPKRAPAYERQLRLAREVLALHPDSGLVGAALSETVEALRAKRESGEDPRPLKNHNYFKRVLESQQAREARPLAPSEPQARQTSKTAAALAQLGRRHR